MRIATRMLGLALASSLVAAHAHAAAGALEVTTTQTAPATVRVTIRNTTPYTIAVPDWHVPARAPTAALLDVRRDGRPVRYTGLRASRAPPSQDDYVVLLPGERVAFEVDLSTTYDVSVPGDYHVRYAVEALAPMMHTSAKRAPAIESSGALVRIDAQHASPSIPRPALAKGTGQLSFTASCTIDDRDALTAAVSQARLYAALGTEYFAHGHDGARYVQWFGAYDPIRYDAASQRMTAIEAAARSANVEFECIPAQSSCPGNSIVAYVSPTSPYRIYTCPRLFDFPIVPADRGFAQSGAIIHELSHFIVVGGGTEDFVYGYTPSANLAASNPANALRNADNWLYFSINTPDLEPHGQFLFRDGFE